MSQRTLSELAQKSVRLSVISEKHQRKLGDTLEKWFLAEFLKNMKLPLLRKIFEAGAYDAFVELLAERGDAERIKLLHKVDEHNPKMQMLSAKDALAHLERLAKGETKPHPKPQQTRKNTGGKTRPPTRGLLASSKY